MDSNNDFKKTIIKTFPGKMENKRALIMQLVMNEIQQGRKPPTKEVIESIIREMVEEEMLEEKGDLLILKVQKVKPAEDLPESNEPITLAKSIEGDYDENEKIVLSAFQGKFENKDALIMNIIMGFVSKGKKPMPKKEIEEVIAKLIKKKVLEEKNNMLIKK